MTEIRPGKEVLSLDAQPLGRVARVRDGGIEVVLGRRAPQGFLVEQEEVCSNLRDVLLLRLPRHRYLPRYEPKDAPAPVPSWRTGALRNRL